MLCGLSQAALRHIRLYWQFRAMKCAIVCEIYQEVSAVALSGAHYNTSYRISFHIFNCDVQSMLLYTCTLKSPVYVYCAIYISIGSTKVMSGNA